MDALPILAQSLLFQGVSLSDLPHLVRCLQPKEVTYPKDYTIIEEGDLLDELAVIVAGSVTVVRHDFWGNRTLVAKLGPGDIFAETVACTADKSVASVITEEKTVVLFLSVQKIISTCSSACVFHQAIIANMIKLLAHKNLVLMQKMNHITKRNTREKLLSFLSEQAKNGGSQQFTIPFDRQQLADYLCVDRSAMSSELGKMKSEGLIEYTKNSFILKRLE
ncbi:MAG TPA: Crp/Fnr family transcriptional regulator [Sphaerochaeta sp.]|nr:Crp/Fnr family transcriptional regulator [Sphaerochaeta sp.]